MATEAVKHWEQRFPNLSKLNPFSGRKQRASQLSITPQRTESIAPVLLTEGLASDVKTECKDHRQKEIETWRKKRRIIQPYDAGGYPDGTTYPAGLTLIIGNKKEPQEEVMNTFETPWCEATVKTMFKDKEGPQTVIERGFGLGIMSSFIRQEMLSRGGDYHIIELNDMVHKDAVRWAVKQQRLIDQMQLPSPLNIIVHHGDADQVLKRFPDESFDLIFSDTHQLTEEERGINDLLQPHLLSRKLKLNGRLSICGFHKYNQTGDLDARQRGLITETDDFDGGYTVFPVALVPHSECSYLTHVDGKQTLVPVTMIFRTRSSRPNAT